MRKKRVDEYLPAQSQCAHCGKTDNGENWDESGQYWYCDDCIAGYIEYLNNGDYSKK